MQIDKIEQLMFYIEPLYQRVCHGAQDVKFDAFLLRCAAHPLNEFAKLLSKNIADPRVEPLYLYACHAEAVHQQEAARFIKEVFDSTSAELVAANERLAVVQEKQSNNKAAQAAAKQAEVRYTCNR